MPPPDSALGQALAWPCPTLDLPPVIGHRGAAGVAPENTLAGIRRVKELGASWVEFDVKLTKDGVPILFHDDRLERTTSGRGRVVKKCWAEIRELDAGSWFDPAFAGERVPTLVETLALCAELGLGVNVEFKPCPGRAEETTRAGLDVVRDVWPKAAPTPLISSFEPACLGVAREVAPELPRGYLSHPLPRRWRDILVRYGCTTLHLNHKRLWAKQLQDVVAAGVPLILFTVNQGFRARALLEAGASAVFTDQIETVRAALD